MIDFPTTAVFDPANVLVLLEEKWMYIRQLASGAQTVAGGNQEFTYYLSYDTIAVEANKRNITTTDEGNFGTVGIRVLGNDTLYVLAVIGGSPDSVQVKKW